MHHALLRRSTCTLSGLLLALALLAGCGDDAGAGSESDAGLDVGSDSDVTADLASPDGADIDGADTDCDVEPDVPATLSVNAADVTITVTRAPFSYRVTNGADEVVLESLADGTGDGYSALAYTAGTLDWSTLISEGYYRLEANLDPWSDALSVVDYDELPDGLTLRLGDGTDDCPTAIVSVSITASPGRVRVEAHQVDDDGVAPRAWAAAFAAPSNEAFMGFGSRFNRVDQRGVDVYNWAEEGGIGIGESELAGPDNPFPNGEAMAYYPVPFFISTAGYGFWLDSTWWSEFNLATDRDDAWRVWHIGPTLAFEVYVARTGDGRPWPYHLIDTFTQVVGRPMLPPAWTMGPRRRIGRRDMQGEVHELQAMRDLDLALTAADDATHFLPGGSHVGREEEMAAWTAFAASLGVRVNGYYNAYFDRAETSPIRDVVEEALAEGYFLVDGEGEPILVQLVSAGPRFIYSADFTSEEATAWYVSLFDWALALGYSGWMYDFGEYVQPETVAASGMTGEELHNLYPVLYQRAAFEALEAGEHAGDWLTFVRSGFTGASQYSPLVWTGDPAASFEDADGLPSVVRAGLNLGIAGAPHSGSDISGFHCVADGAAAADEELLVRWIQQAALTSNMQDQDACSGASGSKANIFTSELGQEVWRRYARLHTRLFPYLYTLAHEATATGAPTMRPLFLEHPDRFDLAAVDDAYYFGPALLAVPVVSRAQRERELDLPDGLYLDWWRHVVVSGGTTVALPAPLDDMPILLRDGHVVPLLDPTIDTLAETLADEANADVVGPTDVADVYDVVGLVSTAVGSAAFETYLGEELEVTWSGSFLAPELPEASDEGELETCEGCWLSDDLGDGLTRVRISAGAGSVEAGGLAVRSTGDRRLRWDLFLQE